MIPMSPFDNNNMANKNVESRKRQPMPRAPPYKYDSPTL